MRYTQIHLIKNHGANFIRYSYLYCGGKYDRDFIAFLCCNDVTERWFFIDYNLI